MSLQESTFLFGVNKQLYRLFLGEWQWSIVAHGFQDVLRIATNDCENDAYTFVVKKNSNVVQCTEYFWQF